jgi:hypothetical protein
MKLTVGDQSIGFFDFDYKELANGNRLGISLSGGTDSAILFYLMAKYLPNDVILVPWSSYEKSDNPLRERPLTIEAAEKIVAFVRNALPDANIAEHYKFTFDRTCPILYKKAELINVPSWSMYPMSTMGVVKMVAMWEEEQIAIDNNMFSMLVGGITMNPPIEDMESNWLPPGWKNKLGPKYELRRSRVSPNIYLNDKSSQNRLMSSYHPFVNVDKSFVAGLYKQEGLMDTLYPMTESCTGFAMATNWFTEPCRECFWCWEKYWAFGSYDGGLTE